MLGKGLAGDLSRLLAIGRIDLPQLAYLYTRLNRQVAATASDDARAFGGGYAPKGSAGPAGGVYQAWATLRDMLQDALAGTATGVHEAADAIVSIVDNYASGDASSAELLRQAWRTGPPADLLLGDGDAVPPATLPPPITSR